MEANEAPEKIYISFIPIKSGGSAYTMVSKDLPKAVEYTRTDAFIEKAVNWLSEHVNDYVINDKYPLPNGEISRDWLKVKSDMFSDFRKAMKGV